MAIFEHQLLEGNTSFCQFSGLKVFVNTWDYFAVAVCLMRLP